MNIIIAEDESITRHWLLKSIEAAKVNACVRGEFSNGGEALEYCLNHKDVDVLITDIKMPVMGGLELVEELLRNELGVYVILLSTYDEFNFARKAMRLGVKEFLLKPETTKAIIRDSLLTAQAAMDEKDTPSPVFISEDQAIRNMELFQEDLCGETFYAVICKSQLTEDREKIQELTELLLQEQKVPQFRFYPLNSSFLLLVTGECLPWMDTWVDLLRQHSNGSHYTGVSCLKSGERVSSLYHRAFAASEFCLFYGIDGWKSYEEISKTMKTLAGELPFSNEINQIRDCVVRFEYGEAESLIAGLYGRIQEQKAFAPSMVQSLAVELLAIFIQKLRTYDLTPKEASLAASVNLGHANEKADMKELTRWLTDTARQLGGILTGKERSYSPPVRTMIQYIRSNLSEELSLNELAELVHLNRTYISTLFKKETGIYLSDFIIQARIAKACGLLETTAVSISRISEDCGFSDAAYFNRMFKKHMEITPAAYRKKSKT